MQLARSEEQLTSMEIAVEDSNIPAVRKKVKEERKKSPILLPRYASYLLGTVTEKPSCALAWIPSSHFTGHCPRETVPRAGFDSQLPLHSSTQLI
ncbi:hypothetical protein E2C01_052896 [Portunus trituberculatus]|uniref:Uncharacterized protein n=1 Tax=Portunus trituberculatus TaxID=210409 RepID=A0A5B7GN13_PORTR|nr:hypothetical protein [Portunus trituberculatus]